MMQIMRNFLLCFLLGLSTTAFSKPPNYIFFQTAAKGNLAKLHKKNYLLALDALPAEVKYFKVPDRRMKAGAIPLSYFLALWRDDKLPHHFVNNPPSAVISLISEKGKQQILIAVLSNPGFDNGAVSYQISVLNRKQIDLGSFKNISLYFYDIEWNPGILRFQ